MMDNTHNNRWPQRAVRTGGAVALGALLGTGAGWSGFAAEHVGTAQVASAQTAPAVTHSIAGGRDSYADVVKVVAPAVVTIRTESKARVSPTQFFGGDDEDMMRRFFGEQFGRGQRTPRTFKQRALGSGVIVTNDG